MQVKSIAECSKGEHYAILLTFIKLPFVIKIFVFVYFSGRFTQVLLYIYVFDFIDPENSYNKNRWKCLELITLERLASMRVSRKVR